MKKRILPSFVYRTWIACLPLIAPLAVSGQMIFQDTFQNAETVSVGINEHAPTGASSIDGTWSSVGSSIRLVANDTPTYGAGGLLYLQNGTTGNVANFSLGSDLITTGDLISLQFNVERLDRDDSLYRSGWLGIGFSNADTDNLAGGNSGPWIRMGENGAGWLYGGAGTNNSTVLDSHFGTQFIPKGGFTTVTFTLDTATGAYSLDNGSGAGALLGTLDPTHTPNYEFLQIRWFGNTTDASFMRVGDVTISVIPEPQAFAALMALAAFAFVAFTRPKRAKEAAL